MVKVRPKQGVHQARSTTSPTPMAAPANGIQLFPLLITHPS